MSFHGNWQDYAAQCLCVTFLMVTSKQQKKAVKFSLFIALFLWSSGSFKFGYPKAD
jgi:hypothetical protein